jgi:regulator of sigma E protease
MLDERTDKVSSDDVAKTFNSKKLYARAIIIAAGPIANFILAMLFFWIALVVGIPGLSPVIGHVLPGGLGDQLGFKAGDQIDQVDQRPVQTWNEFDLYLLNESMKGRDISLGILSENGAHRFIDVDPKGLPEGYLSQSFFGAGLGLVPALPESIAQVGGVIEGSPAALGGIYVGDKIERVDNILVKTWSDLVGIVSVRPLQELDVELMRNGERLIVLMTPESVETTDGVVGRIGVTRDMSVIPLNLLRLGVLHGFIRSIENTRLLSELTVRSVIEMLRLKLSTENIGGPVTIARVAGQSAKTGFVPYLLFLAVVSVSLGILNLLPIPVLDGGHLLYLAIEGVRGAPLSEEAMQIGQRLGLGIIAVLMIVAFYNDFSRLTLGF